MITNKHNGKKKPKKIQHDARAITKKDFIAYWFSKLTRTQRHIPYFQWSKKLWTHNVFRFLESVFGRKAGIRPSVSTAFINGEYIQRAHCLEAQVALFEVWIRNLKRVRIRIEVFQPAFAMPGGMKPLSNFMFAIAVDTQNKATGTGSNVVTISHTCTGSNLVLYGAVELSADDYTVTYNSASLTEIDNQSNGGGNHTINWLKVNPSTGANNAVFTPSGSSANGTHAYTVSYSGCKQTGQPDAHNTALESTNFPTSVGITTVADQCWLVTVINAFNGTPQASTGANLRIARGASNGNGVYDSNGGVAVGSNTMSFTLFSGGPSGADMNILSLAPVTVAPTVTTQAETSINQVSGTGNGNITATGGENADLRGVVFDTGSHADPGNTAPGSSAYPNNVQESGSYGSGAFTESMTGLSPGTIYYVRAWAHNSQGYAYGSEISFSTDGQMVTSFRKRGDRPAPMKPGTPGINALKLPKRGQ